ncbi:MAG: guanylate kinase [Myxococcota bacterium]
MSSAAAGRLGMSPPDRGVLFVVSGPSGVGKSTLLKAALARIPGLAFSVSATTRDPRAGEADGVDYHFVQRERFAELVRDDAFLEHAEVYDRFYGTLRGPTIEALERGDSLILDIDVQGARNVRARLPEAVHLMVVPPDIGTLEARLRARGTDSEAVIERRMAKLAEQLGAVGEFDYVVVNDDLDAAHACFQGVMLAEMSRTSRRGSWVERFAPLTRD